MLSKPSIFFQHNFEYAMSMHKAMMVAMKDSSMARKDRNIGSHGIHWWHEYHGCQHDGFIVSVMRDSSMARKGRNIGSHGIHWWHEYHGCQHDDFSVSDKAYEREWVAYLSSREVCRQVDRPRPA